MQSKAALYVARPGDRGAKATEGRRAQFCALIYPAGVRKLCLVTKNAHCCFLAAIRRQTIQNFRHANRILRAFIEIFGFIAKFVRFICNLRGFVVK